MKIYDDVIREWYTLISENGCTVLEKNREWPDAGNNNMVFQSDMKFMLGGDRRFETSAFAVTEDESLCGWDEILLVGPDIPQINKDMPYSRITVVRLKKDALAEGTELYRDIQEIDFTKYHVNPSGFMLRISSLNGIESVRVSKKAFDNGLDFAAVGKMYIDRYHENPAVEAVRVIFITGESFDYDRLLQSIKKSQNITKTMDHITKDMAVADCATCNLSEICNEVEGLRELHFSMKK